MISHHRALVAFDDARWNVVWTAAGLLSSVHDRDKTVHLAAIDSEVGGLGIMRCTRILVVGIVIGSHARSALRIRHTYLGNAVAHRNAVGAGERSKVAIE